ncbi:MULTISPECIES: sigma-54-dependent transcriptional regulator [Aneurinibacillus]|uniref:Transcriptional regulator n=1 Tax=Aneurinibacillus thermoaerophilus TaxID=143495 RepID=A0A1G7XAA3_ANETH|nr:MULTISPECIES: sigma-54 dependent transcriptional regulator [Aneurinibacillus]AMA73282.1 Fis family transcriptional regulator [Aneurinibacillus sp. XH2]MED0674279.1 sigma-54 dependent transcriptional regulator [Aneurinibacillus thermoaerophilus]MED0678297.1 sigma-54 dependent transcriptional regulator [Aneurinibacillus thermoaerophilus]MED0736177.1 sigma-54 dependent transcriptional regulator [Aneurinibacillus thermoaerophilus]MED0757023.1 sigma-54 dependent transcriptional regulator [Aneuri
MNRMLIVDDETQVQTFFSYLLHRKDIHLSFASNAYEVMAALAGEPYQAALVDLKLPDTNGLDILKAIKEKMPGCRVIIMTGYGTVKSALEAIRLGAEDYIEKPFDDIDELERLIHSLFTSPVNQRQTEMLRLAEQTGFIVGQSTEMHHLLSLAYKIARKNITVLIEGETGTGKEVLARFLHHASARQQQPFIGVNCGAFTETLLESELFGHEKGAFTGATQTRKGLFEIASKGTLFFDEIGDASPSIQVKLLRVLETREFMRIGSEQHRHTDARIIAASHVNLHEAVRQGKFREDLLYRLNVVKLSIPPLRERREDIPYLVQYLAKRHKTGEMFFVSETLALMQEYDWPGNIRELSNVVARALTLADGETSRITPDYLPASIVKPVRISQTSSPSPRNEGQALLPFEDYLESWKQELLAQWQSSIEHIDFPSIMKRIKELERIIEKAFVTKALRETLGNQKKAARLLNISVRTLRYLLNEKGK